MSTVREVLADTRTAVWHLRKGGVSQVRTWARRRAIFGRPLRFDGQALGAPDFPPWPLPDRPPRRPDLRVGVILDDFSRLAFRYEWDQVELTSGLWRSEVDSPRRIDLLFVESAWHGNSDSWQYALTGTSAPRPALVELLEWCRAEGVPTVFWNKEDPVHYDEFLPTARLFDHVWTTDSERVADYQRDLGHNRVGVLPFAAQPRSTTRSGPRPVTKRVTSPSPACTSPTSTQSAARRWTSSSGRLSESHPVCRWAWRSSPASSGATTVTSSPGRWRNASSAR